MDFDPVTLSRVQFALTVMFHYLFPPLSIGLGAIMVLLEGTYLKTGDRRYEAATRFFTKLFAVNFAVGVATGIVMEFQFGTNWSTYSRFVGDVFGSALAAEGIFAFFLESGFLAVLVFGWDRVGKKMHFFSTLMVFLGSTFSAVWIVIANSWQQTPAGFHLVGEGAAMRAEITDFWAMVFNPSAMHRLNHVLLGSLLQGAFFVMSLSAFYLLKKRHVGFAKRTFTVALVLGFVSSITILISGHAQANAVAENQPAKLAAFEGHFETGEGGADLYLFGWPDEEAREVKLGVALPGMLSFLIHGDTETPVKGLDRIPDDEEPPVAVPFVTYHLMVALGMFFIGVTSLALFLRWRGTLWDQRWLLKVFVVAVAGPYIANQTGWVAAEVGRQPWVVYGLLKTQDAASPSVPGEQIFASIVLFSLIYLALGALWVVVMNSKIQHGPEDPEGGDAEGHEGQIAVAADVLDPASPHHLTGRAAPEEA
ncbi:MAG TPA: cytochrome ubiquinol oxidase subunit I [Polyangiaceae bacterium LLY-WYZ-15_(1-7)]|nr:cytochrome ubiquinol oxidase subunit I [Myxococcales bacterium]MAT28704.1 cytochrome ubiquinol oxidase subunit I [Sandaracinus sp.]HJK91844.1 cytochrome ubiquinol oxidase subunit I [Polyangiaceae bacterium LLY-WYZ-15_(1-7)]MBJ69857.1 cytochrome ubiquinol oxidase subunit I [Sandaracinus sp.]HJL02214.1 cytochrome ubiquinol oxidase subunit I [Polyangiaceae bacterium LLY-WYZ-15_(1-7)]